jgi:hypothetical protein
VLGVALWVPGDRDPEPGTRRTAPGDHFAEQGDHFAGQGDHFAEQGDHFAERKMREFAGITCVPAHRVTGPEQSQ